MRKRIDKEGRHPGWLTDVVKKADADGFKGFEFSPAGVRALATFLEERRAGPGRVVSQRRDQNRTESLLKDELEARVYLGCRVLIKEDEHAKTMRSELTDYLRFRDWFQREVYGDHYVATTWSSDLRGIFNLIDFVTEEQGGMGRATPHDCTLSEEDFVWRRIPIGSWKSEVTYQQRAINERTYIASQTTTETLAWFLIHITQNWRDLPHAALEREYKPLSLAISQMMAMQLPYNERDKHGNPSKEAIPGIPATAITSYEQQLKNFDTGRKETDGRSAYFAAWNPFASRNDPDKASWRRGLPADPTDYPEALKQIHRAITQHGAWGVKFYPPMGFRPTGNALNSETDPGPWDEKPKYWERLDKKNAWHGRYDNWTPGDMDALNALLFAYCVKWDIPIFSHCHVGEFQVAANSARFANPYYWELVLQNPKYQKLRLCLGHAGGDKFWFNEREEKQPWYAFLKGNKVKRAINGFEWGQRVARLCGEYPNVYCEVGIHAEVCDPVEGAQFVIRLDSLVNRSEPALAKKIMYGTDWYMPISESPNRYLNGYLHVFQTPELAKHRSAFFGKNAAAYLRIDSRLDSLSRGLSAAGKAHLRDLASQLAR